MLFEKIEEEYSLLTKAIEKKISNRENTIVSLTEDINELNNRNVDIKYIGDGNIFEIKDEFFDIIFSNKNSNIKPLFDSWKKEINLLISKKKKEITELENDIKLLNEAIPNIKDIVEISLVVNSEGEPSIAYSCKSKKYAKFNLLKDFID